MMDAKVAFVILFVGALTVSSTHAQCQGPAQDEYQVAGADVVIGVLQDFYVDSEDGTVCGEADDGTRVLYDAAKLALGALPNGMTTPTFNIGLERYESCGNVGRALESVAHYVSQAADRVNATQHVASPCVDAPFRPGFVGPDTTQEALAISPTLSALGVPSISHAATSTSLSNKDEYGSFLRTVASDVAQAQAMVELLQNFGWSYVHLIYSEGQYGEGGAEAMLGAAKGLIEFASVISFPETGADYGQMVSQLTANSEAKAVVFWGSSSQMIEMLMAVQSAGGSALDLQFVASDDVALTGDDLLAAASVHMAAKGLLTVAPGEYNGVNFQNYLTANGFDGMNNPLVPSVVDAVHVYVNALNRAQADLCGTAMTSGVCDAMKRLDAASFLDQFVKTADFTGVSGRRIAFDQSGDPASPAYETRQYKSDGNSFSTHKVGEWTGSGALSVMSNSLQFYTAGGAVSSLPPTSSCSSGSCPVVYDHYDALKIIGLFPVHYSDCRTFSSHSEFEQARAMLWAMDRVNKDSSLLPGIQLKPAFGDSCTSTEQASGSAFDIAARFSYDPAQAFAPTTYPPWGISHLVGVISRVSDEETVAIDNTLQAPSVPHISDSARLSELSDKDEHPYFSRMVGASCSLVTAILDFVTEHDFKYIQVVQSRDGLYNESASKFIEYATERGICIAQIITFEPTTDFTGVVDRLLAKPAADVVINFADYDDSQFLSSALERRGLPGEFLQIIYAFIEDTLQLDSWNRDAHIDSITLARKTHPVDEFTDYFVTLTPESVMASEGLFADAVQQAWFAEYWMNKFHCQIQLPDVPQIYTVPCTGTEMLQRDDIHSTEGIVNAVYVYARALSALHNDKCSEPGTCSAMLSTTPDEWIQYIRNVRFMSESGSMAEVSFNQDGDGSSAYNFNVLGRYLTNDVIASYDEDSGLEITDPSFAIGTGKESTCRGACYECSSSTELGGSYIRIPGDFDIPAVLWLSEEGTGANLTCGATRYQETMAIEIIKFALEEINNSSLILPGIKLGLTIVDSCGQYLVTARQLTALMGRTAANLPSTGPMIGVLGPVREYLQGHVASDVTSPFYIPTVGFTPASPSVFSDEGPYPASSLLSTAPAYDQQARAVVDILKYKGWHHVVFIYSHSYYGHAGNQSFNEAAMANDICVRDSIGIDLDSTQDVHDEIVRTIRNYDITVVVAFVESGDARGLLTAEKTLASSTSEKITWVGSDKWFTDPKIDVTSGLEDIARGAIVVTNYMVNFDPLKKHLSNLDLVKETKDNQWLRNYVTDDLANGCSTDDCINQVDLGEQAILPSYAATLINAVHVLAQATHNKIQILCGNADYIGRVYKRSGYHSRPSNKSVPLCAEFYEASYHDLLYAVKDVYVFEGAGGRPFWFENRQGPAEYTVINFQGDGTSGSFVPIGEWVSGELTMHDDMMYLYNPAADQRIDAPSECPSDTRECSAAVPDATDNWMWDTNMEAWSVILLIVFAIGGFLSLSSILVFTARRNSSVIKDSSPFLMCMLSLGVILMYLNNIWYMVGAGETSCGVRRWMTSFSYAVVYAALISKAIRSYMLSRQDSSNKSMLNSSVSQIVLFCIFLGAEVVLVSEWLILDTPAAVVAFETNYAGCSVYAGQVCSHSNASIVVSMIYVYILVLATFILSFFNSSSRVRDDSTKDSKFHLLASLLSICILVAWACCFTLIPQAGHQTPAILIGITVDATSIFLFTIVPKMMAFFNRDDEPEVVYDAGDVPRKEKMGLDNNGVSVNDADDQTPF